MAWGCLRNQYGLPSEIVKHKDIFLLQAVGGIALIVLALNMSVRRGVSYFICEAFMDVKTLIVSVCASLSGFRIEKDKAQKRWFESWKYNNLHILGIVASSAITFPYNKQLESLSRVSPFPS
ncbi:hypothetical protein CDL15_Pgr005802 [Punica granatum]|uniref:Uncharacterized protein n=1 Tax=Punica granatum TaxID=22663 RepID=A0A218WFM9_PUNGR|nr:hypothetical protein CDL15_Pgr005802 [Punica granatum]